MGVRLLVELEVPPPLLPALALDVVAGRRRTALPPWLDDDAARARDTSVGEGYAQ